MGRSSPQRRLTQRRLTQRRLTQRRLFTAARRIRIPANSFRTHPTYLLRQLFITARQQNNLLVTALAMLDQTYTRANLDWTLANYEFRSQDAD